MKSNFPEFIKICKYKQSTLKKFVTKELKNYYDNVIVGDGFVFAKGTIPILLTAHMDTVHRECVKTFVEEKSFNEDAGRIEHKISSPQGIGGDDRCGIYMILTILKETELRPYILFCEDEEIGGIGSDKFTESIYIKEIENLKYYIELDRAHENDAVFYSCGNAEFMNYVIDFGFEKDYGSFSDISNLSPVTDVASVNLSCGYYKAHTIEEYVIVEEMYDTIEKVIKMLEDANNAEEYDYQQRKSYYDYDNYYGGYYGGYSSYGSYNKFKEDREALITYYDKETCGKKSELYYLDELETEYELLARFLIEHPDVCFNEVLSYDIY